MRPIKNIFFLFCLVNFSSLLAVEDQSKGGLSGTSVVSGGTYTVNDPKYSYMVTNSGWSSEFTNQSNKVRISLSFLEDDQTYYGSSYTASVSLVVKSWDEDGVAYSDIPITLNIEHDPSLSATTNDLDIYVLPNEAYLVQVDISSVTNTQSPYRKVELKTEIITERYYDFDPSNDVITGENIINETNYFSTVWNPVETAEFYELEYIFIKDYNTTSPTSYDFKNNVTRIRLYENEHRIPKTFPKGYFIYRVRPVGRAGSNFEYEYYGDWSLSETGLISTVGSSNKIYLSEHEGGDLNWSSSTFFMQDGSRIDNVSYSDGLGRYRQGAVRDNEYNQVLVDNTYYDFHGRAVISHLPTPVNDDDALVFRDAFNRDVSGTHPYGPEYFDYDETSGCGITINGPMSENHGSGLYYSGNNPNKDGAQKYVPDADGYPFARIQYTPDNSGRIQRISGLGEDLNLESGKEVWITYESVSHEEISKLFGSNVGKNSEYMRVTTKDQNGQKSTKIYNSSGQVVATFLVGSAGGGLIDHDDNSGGSNAETVLSEGYGENQITPTSFNFVNSYQAEANGTVQLSYLIEPEIFNITQNSCIPIDTCYDCVYDIEITVVEHAALCDDDTVLISIDSTFIGLPVDFECQNDTFELAGSAMSYTATEGKIYTITKTLSVNTDAIEDYVCHYIENSTCIDDYQSIYTSLYDSTNIVCDPIYDTDTANYLNSCETREMAMIMDMRPGGQYGLIYDSNYDLDPSGYPLSIYNTSNQLPSGIAWNDGSITYHLEAGGTLDVSTMSLDDFINIYWEDGFAEDLLPYHPEYCMLTFCSNNSEFYDYQEDILSVYTFSEACSLGYFDPANLLDGFGGHDTWTSNLFSACEDPSTSPVNDPFFASGATGASSLSALQSAMDRYYYYDTGLSNYMSIWEASILTVLCPDLFIDAHGDPIEPTDLKNIDVTSCLGGDLNDCQKDAIWREFQRRYLSLRLKYYSELETQYAIENGCYNGCIGEDNFNVSLNDFDCYPISQTPSCGSDYDADADTLQPCYYDSLYASKNARFMVYNENEFDLYTTAEIDSIVIISGFDSTICASECEEMAESWMLSLDSCGLSYSDSIAIRNEFIELCTNGCDEQNQFGSSTVPIEDSTSNGNTSFYEILEYHLGSGFEDELCSDLLISNIRPHDQGTTISTPILDDCGCDKVLSASYYFNQGDTTQIGSATTVFGAYQNMYGMVPPGELNQYICLCSEAFDLTASGSYHPTTNNTWNTAATDFLEDQNIGVDQFLSCGTCSDCSTVQSAFSAFLSRFSGITDFENTSNYSTYLENYMNNTLGYHLSAGDYESFIDKCSSSSSDTVCYDNPVLTSLVPLWDLLAKLGQLEVSIGSPLDLTDYIPYNYSEFKQDQTHHEYWSSISSNTLTMNYGISGSSCSIELSLPSGSGITFGELIGFEDLTPYYDECGDIDDFIITGYYFDCGEKVPIQLTGTSSCVAATTCYCGGFSGTLCDEYSILLGDNSCWQDQLAIIASNAEDIYTADLEDLKQEFREDMLEHCRLAFGSEKFTQTRKENRYQHTLMVYDRAGNLQQTIPPNGVDNSFTGIDPSDIGNTSNFDSPDHEMESNYRYNTLGQVIESNTPDEGTTKFWYDYYGRLVASQNSEQIGDGKYFYTLFDDDGRVVEYGQVFETNTSLTESIVKGLSGEFETWVGTGTKNEWNRIIYDDPINTTVPTKFANGTQENTRLRVATIAYYLDHETNYDNFDFATHYSYDAHGNIKEAIQDNAYLGFSGLQYLSTKYDFEKLTGKIREIIYQDGKSEEIGYTYDYDRNHRLKDVYTLSRDVFKTLEAKYHYYQHGPIAREEIGEKQVQGVDMAYTINGWLKGVNSNTLNTSRDQGVDNNTGYLADNDDVHLDFAQDIYGFTLGYFDGDYLAIGGSSFEATQAGSFSSGISDLYNGAISSSVNAINSLEVLGYAYTYDQLYRIKEMDAFRGVDLNNNTWSTGSSTTDFLCRYSYDNSGNLDYLKRNGISSTATDMDEFTYNYGTNPLGTNLNQLIRVDDSKASGNYSVDIDDQTGTNYEYDNLGRITKDVSEGISDIDWNSRNLIKKITYTNDDYVEFFYNAQGARTVKVKYIDSGPSYIIKYYGLDGSGSTVTLYDLDYVNFDFTAEEQYIYGNGRVGTWDRNLLVFDGGSPVDYTPSDDIYHFERGERQYEMVNHLGNVLSVVSDRKVGFDDVGSDNIIDRYETYQIAYSDYYPFGMPMPGRNSGGDYRFQFNGMEQDPEVKGNGNSYTTPFRQYDPRLGRWMTPDPLMSILPQFSPYVAMNNNPISLTDPMGLEAEPSGPSSGGASSGGTGTLTDSNTPASMIGPNAGWANYMALGNIINTQGVSDPPRNPDGSILNNLPANARITYNDEDNISWSEDIGNGESIFKSYPVQRGSVRQFTVTNDFGEDETYSPVFGGDSKTFKGWWSQECGCYWQGILSDDLDDLADEGPREEPLLNSVVAQKNNSPAKKDESPILGENALNPNNLEKEDEENQRNLIQEITIPVRTISLIGGMTFFPANGAKDLAIFGKISRAFGIIGIGTSAIAVGYEIWMIIDDYNNGREVSGLRVVKTTFGAIGVLASTVVWALKLSSPVGWAIGGVGLIITIATLP